MSSEDNAGIRSRVFKLSLVLGGFAMLWGIVWYCVRDRVVASRSYQLSPEELEITPPPPWIHSDIKAEVLRDASLDGPLSILDDDLTQRLHDAFPLHPWVDRVEQVSKHYPARVKVSLVYRKPVCMVKVPGGVFAVDVYSVVLPSDDFSAKSARRYPLLSDIRSVPIGQVGAAWGDPRVESGCRVAASLVEVWSRFQLERITPSQEPTGDGSSTYAFEILTRGGTRILWGEQAAGDDPAHAKTATAKVALLSQYVAEHGSLEKPDGPRLIDVRRSAIEVTPRTASVEDATPR